MPRTVAVLIFPQFQLLDAAGPITVFEAAGRDAAPPAYRLRVMARAAGRVVSSCGVPLVAEPLIDGALDTLIVAGGWGTRNTSSCVQTLGYGHAAGARGRCTVAVCAGW